jgi:hypothetical protein
MVPKNDGRSCQYPSCGFNPEINSACIKVRAAYGQCCGPCDSPCYTVSCAHYPLDFKAGGR